VESAQNSKFHEATKGRRELHAFRTYSAESALSAMSGEVAITRDERLHLATSMRSFRCEKVSAFVKTLLACDVDAARSLLQDVSRHYPIVITRELTRAKDWVRNHSRGSERFGLVASSKAQRLKPHAIDVRVDINPIHWFLNGPSDTRSSYYLEDAATEFDIQGLELDWTCVSWDADLRMANGCWEYHSFRGKRWQRIQRPESQNYLLNAYRVLLTRARQGMTIFVPRGDIADSTRPPRFYDETYGYLSSLGIQEV